MGLNVFYFSCISYSIILLLVIHTILLLFIHTILLLFIHTILLLVIHTILLLVIHTILLLVIHTSLPSPSLASHPFTRFVFLTAGPHGHCWLMVPLVHISSSCQGSVETAN